MRILVAGLAAVAVLAVLVVAVRGTPAAGPAPAPAPAPAAPPPVEPVLVSSLQPFDDCDELVGYFRETALEQVGPYGLGDSGPIIAFEAAGGAEELTAGAAGDAARAVGPGETGTNVQEAGIDEPDRVKTNGELVLAIAGNRLQVVMPGAEPRVAGTLALPEGWDHELLVEGDHALVLTRAQTQPWADTRVADLTPFRQTSLLTTVDLTDPSDPRVEATLELDGDYRSARVRDGVARVVVSSFPIALPLVTPEGAGLRAEREAEQRNRAAVESADEQEWLPWSVLTDGDGDVLREGPLLECRDVARPRDASGLGVVSVLTVDLRAGLEARDATGLVASGETVYASPDRLYVATPVEGQGTAIHAFDLSDPTTAPHVASGRVAGTLLNSYALSAHAGRLRAATTTGQQWGPEEADPSQSGVVVLEERGEQLAEVGRVDGLGPTETIRGVRFLGDLAAVVTFRQTDPLYLVDLSDPAAPRLRGELKIPGYSAYLHPVADDRLLGVGQDATDDGRLLGMQASLFDLSDLAAPARLDALDLGQASAAVESDPHAFLYWPDAALAVLPIQPYAIGDVGAVAVRVEGDRLLDLGTLEAGGTPVTRALVLDGQLYAVSDSGIGAHDLATLEPLGFARFR